MYVYTIRVEKNHQTKRAASPSSFFFFFFSAKKALEKTLEKTRHTTKCIILPRKVLTRKRRDSKKKYTREKK